MTGEKSLLPIGVVNVKNKFQKGDVISILDENNNEFARGIVNYDSDSCKKLSDAILITLQKFLDLKTTMPLLQEIILLFYKKGNIWTL